MLANAVRYIFLGCLIGAFSGDSYAQEGILEQAAPGSTEGYQILAVANAAGIPPENIIRLDNNFQILRECLTGKTTAQLRRSPLEFNESQIQLLVDWSFLRREKNALVTTFPILDEKRTEYVRRSIRAAAADVGRQIHNEIRSFSDVLRQQGFEQAAYPILFSYILDDLSRRIFAGKNIAVNSEITPEHPFWNGIVWAVCPPRTFQISTTGIATKKCALKISWNEGLSDEVNALLGAIEPLSAMVAEIGERERVMT